MRSLSLPLAFVSMLSSCSPVPSDSPPIPGPDKQAAGQVTGAALGAGTGAVTGFQLGSAAGPAAFVGAGLGAVAGGIQGAIDDSSDETMLALAARTRRERERAEVHELLQDQMKRRTELHPTREIYPADLFFSGDETKLNSRGTRVVEELARMNKNRMPWSRLVVATYVKANAEQSDWAEHLAKNRAIQISDFLIKFGINPRRVDTRPVIVKEPILIDPDDKPGRYNQAVEIIAVDR